MSPEERKAFMAEIVNDRGETRREHLARCQATAKKLAAVLTESAASYEEVDSLFREAKKLLYITDRIPPHPPALP